MGLSHTISPEQTCHFFHLTTSAISPSALIISPTPFFLDYEPAMFQKTLAFLLCWKDTKAQPFTGKIRTESPGKMRRLSFLFYRSLK